MKIYILGDSDTQKIDVVRLDGMEDAHQYYLDQKMITLGKLEQIAGNKEIPAIYRKWIKEAYDLIKTGEF